MKTPDSESREKRILREEIDRYKALVSSWESRLALTEKDKAEKKAMLDECRPILAGYQKRLEKLVKKRRTHFQRAGGWY